VLQKEKEIGNAFGAALLDKQLLQAQRVPVRNNAKPANLKRS
jgi:hypothetical protein